MDQTVEAITTLRNYRNQNMKDYRIMVEYKVLKEDAPRGVYLMPSFDNLRVYFGVIFVEMGLYRNGIFKFRLELPEGYPGDGARPKVFFFSNVFHPMVHPRTKELDLASRIPQWRTGKHHIATVLKLIKQIFYVTDMGTLTNSFNPSAAELYVKKQDLFQANVEQCVLESIERRFLSEPGSTLKFTETNAQHEMLLKHILKKKEKKKDEGDEGSDENSSNANAAVAEQTSMDDSAKMAASPTMDSALTSESP